MRGLSVIYAGSSLLMNPSPRRGERQSAVIVTITAQIVIVFCREFILSIVGKPVSGCPERDCGRRKDSKEISIKKKFPPRRDAAQAQEDVNILYLDLGCSFLYIKRRFLGRRAGRTAIAPVLKTGVRKGLGVRIPRSPQKETGERSSGSY